MRISRAIRGWALHHRNDKSLAELAQMYNPCSRGWITYYSPTMKRIDAYVIRWARLLRDNLDENGGGNRSLKRRPVAKA